MSICSLQNNDKVSTTRLPNYLIETQSFFHSPFFCKKAAQKHGYKSVPHSMADSCCKGWYPCFLFCCHTFLGICRIRSGFLCPREVGEGNQEPVYRDSWFFFCQSCIPAGIFAIYMTDGNRILPWSFLISFSIHLYCISTPFLQPSLRISF